MVNNASMALIIGVYLAFGPKTPLEFEHLDKKKIFGQDYILLQPLQKLDPPEVFLNNRLIQCQYYEGI